MMDASRLTSGFETQIFTELLSAWVWFAHYDYPKTVGRSETAKTDHA